MTEAGAAATQNQEARALIRELQARFAVLRECRPLAIGIDKQLIAAIPGLDAKLLRRSLAFHTRSMPYLKAMAKATVRYNLDGEAAGEVPEEHRVHAQEMLRERIRKQNEKRKAEQAAHQETERLNAKLTALADKFKR